eukprot:TRINITY_DN38110_c0_g1_i1.p1 TRINITY_DN38110_c0_g1~~TRINITY_DN38110_c0_g1_i1.p1  ORF type:complete len:557 (-),score=172.82 TRINITY_DN38110_c0_g1_i1:24-1655(-)
MDAWFSKKADEVVPSFGALDRLAQAAQNKADELAQAAQQQVSELQQHASASASKLNEAVQFMSSSSAAAKKDLEFGSGPLGFVLEGALVVNVEDGSQAASRGVEVGDRLVAIDGFVLPRCKETDVAGTDRNNRNIRKWLKEMPRPGRLQFEVPTGAKDSEAITSLSSAVTEAAVDAESEHVEVPEQAEQSSSQATAATQDSSKEEVQREDITKREESSQGDLETVRRALAETQASLEAETKKLEAEKRKSAKFLEELGAARSRNKELLAASSSREAEKEGALEAKESEASALTEEVQRLSGALEEMTSRATAAEERSARVEEQLKEVLGHLGGFQAAHDAELELVRAEEGEQSNKQRAKIEERERLAAEALEAALRRAEEAERLAAEQQAAAEAAADEAQAAGVEAQGARRAALDAEEQVEPLQTRIQVLEKQVSSLQQKLNTRVLQTGAAAGRAGGGQSIPFWLPAVQSVAGPRAGAVSMLLYTVPDRAMRLFTERLLEHNTLLWIFYLHVLFLYVIAASWYTRSFDPSRPVDAINAKLRGS